MSSIEDETVPAAGDEPVEAAETETETDAETTEEQPAEEEQPTDPAAEFDGLSRKELNEVAKTAGVAKPDKIKGGVPAVIEAILEKRAAGDEPVEAAPPRARRADDVSGFWGGPHAWFRRTPGAPAVLVSRDVTGSKGDACDKVTELLGAGKAWVGTLADEPNASDVDPGVLETVFEHNEQHRPLV